MNNPFDYIPDAECAEAFGKLIARLEVLKKSAYYDDVNFCQELESGKMLGVLVADDSSGTHHTLYAFSGQLGNGGFYHEGFVEPVFDYLQPDGHFKTKEREISGLNYEIAVFEKEYFPKIKEDFLQAEKMMQEAVEAFKEKCRLSKLERDSRRNAGIEDESELAAMIRQSQFEKAELHRLKKRLAANIAPYASKLKEAQSYLDSLKERRCAESEELQKWLFTNFRLLNAKGEEKNVWEIFADTPMRIPPSGAGECCAPKLLQAAYRRGWKPFAIAEYWYGKPKGGEVRIHGEHYPACRGKCLPLLSWMLQGLDIYPPLDSERQSLARHTPKIIYENRWFCVVDKPAGMLSVPGKGAAISLDEWLIEKYGVEKCVKMAHRLDQDTSGLVVATFGELALKVMQRLFAMRSIKKTYVADLEGDRKLQDIPISGRIELPLSPDYLDRPRQRADFEKGKNAVTEYEFTDCSAGRSRVIFRPFTGRTHQLRVHSASDMGLGMPIVGDRLYGKNRGYGSGRLHLHAHKLEFTFPIDKMDYSFESPVPF